MDSEAQPEVGSREGRGRIGERLAERLGGEGAVRRAEGVECDPEFGVGDLDVGGGAKEFVQEGAALDGVAGVVLAQEGQ